MRTLPAAKALLAIVLAMIAVPYLALAQEDENFKWYGVGGEIDYPNRWLARIGMTENLGAELIFGLEHISQDCETGQGDCDFTELKVGAGVVYDFVPTEQVTPYLGGRFILTMTDNGESETAGAVEAAGGVEYVIRKRVGLGGELNFSFGTNPTRILTTTRIRFYFYL
jgi:hypothetical protein